VTLKETTKIRRKKKLGSFPYLSVVFSITLALFVLGLFATIMLYSKRLTEILRENIEIQVYLKKNVNETERLQIQKVLSEKPFLAQNREEGALMYISKDQAAEEFIAETGEDFINFLGDNPLRDAYMIYIGADFQENESLAQIKAELERLPGVFEVVYAENLIGSIKNNIAKIAAILGGVLLILLITVIVLINNTIKLALFSQRFLIRSMQLVGATAGFIHRPFLMRGLLHGVVSGILAFLAIYSLQQYAVIKVPEIQVLIQSEFTWILLVCLILLGSLIGFFSTYRSVRKYLKMSLDELY
jgi:cell division transport system permease protein